MTQSKRKTLVLLKRFSKLSIYVLIPSITHKDAFPKKKSLFPLSFFSLELANQVSWVKEWLILAPLYHSRLLHQHLHISQTITAESYRTRTRNLWLQWQQHVDFRFILIALPHCSFLFCQPEISYYFWKIYVITAHWTQDRN